MTAKRLLSNQQTGISNKTKAITKAAVMGDAPHRCRNRNGIARAKGNDP
jgi:hypothetical protein